MSQPRILVINADDLGLSPEVDAGILDCVKAGTVTAVSLMVNTLHTPDLAPFVDAGISLCLHAANTATEDELRAQLDRFRKLTGSEPAQLNFHKHLHARDGRLMEVALALARETGAPLRAVNPAMRDRCRACGVRTSDHFVGDVAQEPYWTEARVREVLATLPPGETELMCHPGKNVGPIAGLFYLAQRDTERATFTSPATAALLGGFQLRGFQR